MREGQCSSGPFHFRIFL